MKQAGTAAHSSVLWILQPAGLLHSEPPHGFNSTIENVIRRMRVSVQEVSVKLARRYQSLARWRPRLQAAFAGLWSQSLQARLRV